MKRKNPRALKLTCVVALLALTAITLIGRRQNVHAKNQVNVQQSADQFVPGRVLVKFHDDILPAHARNIIAALGARDAGEIPNIGFHILDLPFQASEKAFVERFQAQAEVEFAELDHLQLLAGMPNDPYYGSEWHLTKINAPTAWNSTTGGNSVIIAILDTGVDGTHPDLGSKLVPGWNFYDNNADTSDVNGHGTAVAGTVAAATNNGVGVAAVAWNCQLMPVQVASAEGWTSDSALATGVTWAADHGARV